MKKLCTSANYIRDDKLIQMALQFSHIYSYIYNNFLVHTKRYGFQIKL